MGTIGRGDVSITNGGGARLKRGATRSNGCSGIHTLYVWGTDPGTPFLDADTHPLASRTPPLEH